MDESARRTLAPYRLYALAATPVVLWGTSFAALKTAVTMISPAGLVAVRAALGLLVLLAAAAARGGRGAGPARAGDGLRVVLLAVLGVPVQLGLQAYALRLTSANHSGWIIGVAPISTAVLAWLFLGERFPRLKAAGVALGFAGVLLVMAGGGRRTLGLPAARGDLLVLVSAFNWSIYTLVGREMMSRRPSLPLTVRILALGAALAVVGYVILGAPAELARVPLRGWVLLAYLGIGCTGIGYLCWSAALERLEAGRLASFQNVQPLVSALTAALWLGESIGLTAGVGGLLVLLGVGLVQRGARA